MLSVSTVGRFSEGHDAAVRFEYCRGIEATKACLDATEIHSGCIRTTSRMPPYNCISIAFDCDEGTGMPAAIDAIHIRQLC